MEELEKDMPTRESIKKRLKEQTNFGVAAAFFKAAAGDKPDFLSAIAEGFGGAADVMNKMTGQEQKELMQHAMDAYKREGEKANTAFKRSESDYDKLYKERTLLENSKTADRDYQLKIIDLKNNNYWKQFDAKVKGIEVGLEEAKFSGDQQKYARDGIIEMTKALDDSISAFMEIADQSVFTYDEVATAKSIELGAAEHFVPGARIYINRNLKDLTKRLSKAEQGLRSENLSDIERMEQAYRNVYQDLRDNNAIGSLAVLQKYGQDIADIARLPTPKERNQAMRLFKEKYPYLDEEIVNKALGS